MSVDDTPYSSVLSYPTFTEVEMILKEDFEILASQMEYGMPTFLYRWKRPISKSQETPTIQTTGDELASNVPDPEIQRQVFEKIHQRSKELKVWPIIRWSR